MTRAAASCGRQFESLEIGHPEYLALLEPETAFWALVKRGRAPQTLSEGKLKDAYLKKSKLFSQEMERLRFSQNPSAVYFNPTERCNLNCAYCYIPETMRSGGKHMTESRILDALGVLKNYFKRSLPKGVLPQVIFHGAEPLLNRQAVFAGIEKYSRDFRFGIQTNSTLLDETAVEFLIRRNVSIGLSLDAPTPVVSALTRKNWSGQGVFEKITRAMDRLRGYPHWSVICTITEQNAKDLTDLVNFLHKREVPTCMLNVLRCTLPSSRLVKCSDLKAAKYFLEALDRTVELYKETGRKLTVANFANVLIAILAPAARRLMCDISPCGGGRCFFALAPNGDLFPCSEFIGLPAFAGGNIFRQGIEEILASAPFRLVTGRKVEDIESCRDCPIRHFCGSPCPAEACEMRGGMAEQGGFCEFYQEQVKYAFRVIADGAQDAYLWDHWDQGTRNIFNYRSC